jgi:hypothetical protein
MVPCIYCTYLLCQEFMIFPLFFVSKSQSYCLTVYLGVHCSFRQVNIAQQILFWGRRKLQICVYPKKQGSLEETDNGGKNAQISLEVIGSTGRVDHLIGGGVDVGRLSTAWWPRSSTKTRRSHKNGKHTEIILKRCWIILWWLLLSYKHNGIPN